MKNKFTFAASSLLIIFAFTFCKKKRSEPEPAPVVPAQPGTRAVFESNKLAFATGTNISYSDGVSSGFLSSQDVVMNSPSTGSCLDIGSVSLNGVIFKKNVSIQNFYRDSTYNIPASIPQVWSVSGSGNMAAFTHSNSSSYPSFPGHINVPDSFQITGVANIPLIDRTNVDEIMVMLYRSANYTLTVGPKFLNGSATTCQITSSELGTLGQGNDLNVAIYFYKNNVTEIDGKKCNFRTGLMYIKNFVKLK
jgi:hypothetical protein